MYKFNDNALCISLAVWQDNALCISISISLAVWQDNALCISISLAVWQDNALCISISLAVWQDNALCKSITWLLYRNNFRGLIIKNSCIHLPVVICNLISHNWPISKIHSPKCIKCACFVSDESQFRNLIVWLEDQKIRHYKIEDREALRNTDSETWPDAFSKVQPLFLCG